jgi:hypothetical protein
MRMGPWWFPARVVRPLITLVRTVRYREKYGLTYIDVPETSMTPVAKVIERMRSA